MTATDLNHKRPANSSKKVKKARNKSKHRRGANELKIAILVSAEDESIVLDTENQILIRTELPGSVRSICGVFEMVTCHFDRNPNNIDPSRPETAKVQGDVHLTGKRLRRRKAHKLLKPLIAPNHSALLGFRGPAASYWTVSGNYPSLTVVSPDRGPILLLRKDGSLWLRFGIGPNVEELPLIDNRIITTVRSSGSRKFSGKKLQNVLGWKPRLIVVGLSAPQNGYCYKTVLGLLP